MPKKLQRTRVRDAKTGRFLPKGTDKRRPATTVKETVKPCKPHTRAKGKLHWELRTRIGYLIASGECVGDVFILQYRSDVGVVPPIPMTRTAVMAIAPLGEHLTLYSPSEGEASQQKIKRQYPHAPTPKHYDETYQALENCTS